MIHDISNIDYQVLLAIGKYHDETLACPSFEDLRQMTGLNNDTLYGILPSLKRRGYITYDTDKRGRMKPRTIRYAEVQNDR